MPVSLSTPLLLGPPFCSPTDTEMLPVGCIGFIFGFACRSGLHYFFLFLLKSELARPHHSHCSIATLIRRIQLLSSQFSFTMYNNGRPSPFFPSQYYELQHES